MKSLMTSAAVAALALSFSAPAYADCSAEIAALKSQQFTGSIQSPAGATATEEPETGDQAAAVETELKPAAKSQEQTAAAPAEDLAAVDVAAAVPADGAIGPTAAINQVTEEIATSAEEVANEPTAQPAETAPNAEQLANQAATGEGIAIPGSVTSGGEPVNTIEVLAARAEAYNNLGNEAACMNVIEQAKTT